MLMMLFFRYSYDKLCHCWSVDAESRPSVESLVEFFTLTDTGGSVDVSDMPFCVIIIYV